MTKPRTRRNKPQQARDILRALLKDQETKAQRLYDAYDVAEAEAIRTRRAIELLDQAVLPGMEPEPPIGLGPSVPPWPMGVDTSSTATPGLTLTDDAPRPTIIVDRTVGDGSGGNPRPRRQRIGEKAPSGCAHPQTSVDTDGRRTCRVCHERVIYQGE